MKIQNKDVPIETILRHALREKGQLASEVAHLESENKRLRQQLSLRDKAIEDFKAWQSKVAERNYEYWLTKGLSLMQNLPSQEEIKALRGLFGTYSTFDRYYKRALKALNKMEIHAQTLKQ